MGPWRSVRLAKCQLLVTGLFVLLLGLSVAAVTALTYTHFAVISRVSLERNPYEAVHRWACLAGIVLAALLGLGALLSAVATVREAEGLMAGGFLCFALVFCALVQVAFWRLRSPSQAEDAVLDVYDLVYEQAVRSPPGSQRQELVAVQDTFQCCGKRSPFSLLGSVEVELCPGEEAKREKRLEGHLEDGRSWQDGQPGQRMVPAGFQGRQDCLRGIRSLLQTHLGVASTLTCLALGLMLYALLLSAFLWSAVRSGRSLDRRGQYSLTPR